LSGHLPPDHGHRNERCDASRANRRRQFVAHIAPLPGYDGVPSKRRPGAGTSRQPASRQYRLSRYHKTPQNAVSGSVRPAKSTWSRANQKRVQTSCRHRAGDRNSQGGSAHEPQLSLASQAAMPSAIRAARLIQWLRPLTLRIRIVASFAA
jgi:hypothetical protein